VLPSITAVAWSVGGWQVSRSDGYGRSYDWSKDVPAIKAPTLLVFGYAELSALRMPYSSLSSLAGARRTAAGTDQGYPTPGAQFYPA
jgi:hypothetical protein